MERRHLLVRPSSLARYWGLHPKTLYLWVRTGKLAAVRTPGGQYRVDPDAVRSLAREHALPLPPFVKPTDRRVMVVESPRAVLSTIRRECGALALAVEAWGDGYEAMLAAAAAPPAVLVTPIRCDGFDALRAMRALRKVRAAERVVVIAYGAEQTRDERAARRAGATRVIAANGAASSAREVAVSIRRIFGTAVERPRASSVAAGPSKRRR